MIKFFLVCGVVGPALFITVFLIEGLIRQGYNPLRHYVSSLSLGKRGWIQISNFIICGVSMIFFSIAVWKKIAFGIEVGIVAILLFIFGLGLVVSGVFTTDPTLGYPIGTTNPWPHTLASRHGTIHNRASLIVFSSLPIATFIMAEYFFTEEDKIGWCIYSVVTGIFILFFFFAADILAERDAQRTLTNAPVGLFQRISIIIGWSWIVFLQVTY